MRKIVLCLLSGLIASEGAAQQASNPAGYLPPIQIIADTPLIGSGVDADKVPTTSQILTSKDISATGGPPSMTNALMYNVGSVNLDSTFGNPYQPDMTFRGFIASPVVGVPQGFAVYVNGVRANEAFGDTVNWDLIPDFAIESMDLTSANPVFGLNALGGAAVVKLKDGFTFHGLSGDLSSGSFGRTTGITEFGHKFTPNLAMYFGADASYESGWRDYSPSRVNKLYSDLGYDDGQKSLHLSATFADNTLNAMGFTPISFLQQDWGAGINYPGKANNNSYTFSLRGSDKITDTTSLQANLYFRNFTQDYINGTLLNAAPCASANGNLCTQDNTGAFTVPLLDQNKHAVPITALQGVGDGSNFPGYDAISRTVTNTVGGVLQGTSNAPIVEHANHFVAGASLDYADTGFRSDSQLGAFDDRRWLNTTPLYVTAAGTLNNVNLDVQNTYWGAYFTDTFDATDKLSVTASGRYNLGILRLNDELGGDLGGYHNYGRFNPSAGATYKIKPWVTAYANYAESNRIPSPAELSCSDPSQSCSLASFFIADPDLHQVVARTWEGGFRGTFTPTQEAQMRWHLNGFRTTNTNDIIEEATKSVGRGFFQNDGTTRRQGIEAGTNFLTDHWALRADYSFVQATFQSALTLNSPNSPTADANGHIQIRPGDILPNVPQHRLKLGADYTGMRKKLTVGVTLNLVSSQYFIGDESNQNSQVPGYGVVGLHAAYSINKWLQVYANVDNLLDHHYFLSGTYTNISGLPGTNVTTTSAYVPAPPFGGWIGLRARL